MKYIANRNQDMKVVKKYLSLEKLYNFLKKKV